MEETKGDIEPGPDWRKVPDGYTKEQFEKDVRELIANRKRNYLKDEKGVLKLFDLESLLALKYIVHNEGEQLGWGLNQEGDDTVATVMEEREFENKVDGRIFQPWQLHQASKEMGWKKKNKKGSPHKPKAQEPGLFEQRNTHLKEIKELKEQVSALQEDKAALKLQLEEMKENQAKLIKAAEAAESGRWSSFLISTSRTDILDEFYTVTSGWDTNTVADPEEVEVAAEMGELSISS